MSEMQLDATPKVRRERRRRLKTNLRKYAKSFDMSKWFGRRSQSGGITGLFFKKISHLKLRDFEAWGTTCCIGGAARLISGREEGFQQQVYYGFPDGSVYYRTAWPPNLYIKYLQAQRRGDHSTMVEAACEAIDYYGR